MQEALLLVEQLGALGALPLEPADGVLAAPRVPDHRQEHR